MFPLRQPGAKIRLEETPSYQLFHRLFLCRSNYIQSLSEFEVREIGIVSSMDLDYDKERVNEMTTRYLPISRMVELFAKGVNIAIPDEKDTKLIYDIIIGHLEVWKDFASRSLNITDIPIEDFKLLSDFAGKVYKYAQHQYLTELSDSSFLRNLQKTQSVVAIDRIFKNGIAAEQGGLKSRRVQDVDLSQIETDDLVAEAEAKEVQGPHTSLMSAFNESKRFRFNQNK